MSLWGWCSGWEGQEQTLDDKPHFARWLETVGNRPAVQAGQSLKIELRGGHQSKDAQKVLFKR